jgi:predicted negative regulator of RcsB-dependent stress response
MRGMWWVVAVVVVVVLVATYLTWTAARVDRLHARAYAAYAALDAHLVRRAAAASAVAEAVQLPALMYAARVALDARPDERDVAENDLTRQLRNVLAEAGSPAFTEIIAISRRVALARQVHNDVVRDALAVRRRLSVRALRLARKHPRPAYFDVDDPALESAQVAPVTPPA